MNVNNDIKEFISDIIRKSNITPPVDVEYHVGSQLGDGLSSKNVAVDIKGKNDSLNLFLKCDLDLPENERWSKEKTDRIFASEAYFYDEIRAAYENFSKRRNIELRHVAKSYGTSTKKIIAMENLKKRNFVLYDKTQSMTDAHLAYVMKALARLHAVSFSFKDQERSKYEELAANTFDGFAVNGRDFGFDKMIISSIHEFLNKLDTVEDKHILDGCVNLGNRLVEAVMQDKTLDESSILTQGDSWINNMMFLYEDDCKEIPKDMVFVDFQGVRQASPVFDVSYFFYTIASKEALLDLPKYLKIYHEELSTHIRELGSDPQELYPCVALEREWKKYCKYGFAMAFVVLKVMFYSKEEIPDFDNMDMKELEKNPALLFPAMKNDEEYIKRLKYIAEHLLQNDFL